LQHYQGFLCFTLRQCSPFSGCRLFSGFTKPLIISGVHFRLLRIFSGFAKEPEILPLPEIGKFSV